MKEGLEKCNGMKMGVSKRTGRGEWGKGKNNRGLQASIVLA